MARGNRPPRVSKDLAVVANTDAADARIAQFLGVDLAPVPDASVTPLHQPATIAAGRSNRRGTTLLIDRPRDVWPWLDRRRDKDPDRPKGTLLLVFASLLVLLLAAGQGYVSWFAQYMFILAAKHAAVPSQIQALGLDAGAVIFALLALAQARMERRAIVARVLNVSCAAGSLAMNVLAADVHSPRDIAIFAMPSALYATASDQLISVVRRHALPAREDDEEQRSSWVLAWDGVAAVAKVAGLIPLYLLRFVFAFRPTFFGMRQWLLNATPLPEVEEKDSETRGTPGQEQEKKQQHPEPRKSPQRTRKSRRGSGPTKKSLLLKLYAAEAGFGDKTQITRIAAALAGVANLSQGTARAYIYDLLNHTPADEMDRVRKELLAGSDVA